MYMYVYLERTSVSELLIPYSTALISRSTHNPARSSHTIRRYSRYTMRPVALASALFIAQLGLAAPSGNSFDPCTASASELVLRELKAARPAPRSTELKQATRADVVDRLARRGRGGDKRQAATSPGVVTCVSDSTAASGTPKYAVIQKVQVTNLGVSLDFSVWTVRHGERRVECRVSSVQAMMSIHAQDIADVSLPDNIDRQLSR
jgi:hypothetical protein